MKIKWRSKTVNFTPPDIKTFTREECLHFMEFGLQELYRKEARRVMGKGASEADTEAHLAVYRPTAPDKLAKLKRKPWKDLTEAEREALKNGS